MCSTRIRSSIGVAACVAIVLSGAACPPLAAAADSPAAPSAPDAAASDEVSAAGVTLKSVSIELPSSDRLFPDGEGVEAVNNNCLLCHSAGMVLNQPRLNAATWQAEVNKMRAVYKAPIDAGDVAAIVAYLTRLKGAP